jgi:hypothetical protein
MINHLKRELIRVAEAAGLNSYHTICCSQKLDELITIYQKLSYRKQKSRNILLNDNKAV